MMYMPGITQKITQLVEQAVAEITGDSVPFAFELERPVDSKHGDYASNAAMMLFSKAKKSGVVLETTNPRALAEEIVSKIQEQLDDNSEISEISVAGPGFINFKLSKKYFLEQTQQLLTKPMSELLALKEWQNKKVFVEFTDPNPFKQLHIGHAYSNSVGESITRLLKAAGAQVYQACYQGDVGMHVAKSIWGLLNVTFAEVDGFNELKEQGSLLDAVKQTLQKLEHEQSPLKNDDVPADSLTQLLGKAYAAGATAYKEDETAQEETKQINFLSYLSAQRRLVKEEDWEPQVDYTELTEVDQDLYKVVEVIFETGRRWSMEYFELMYGRLGMEQKKTGTYFDYYFAESVVGEFGMKIVSEFLDKGVFKKSDGAIIFPGSDYGLHDRVFINSLGLPTYEAKELGLAPEKYTKVKYDKSIIITGNEIDEYFKVLLTALGQTNPTLAAKTTHMSHGMVRLPEGKMSSRTGKVITAQQVLDEAESEIAKVLEENRPNMSDETKQDVAQKVGLSALKYAFLKQGIGGDIAFDFKESLSFTGQSGPYLEYMYVRCKAILDDAKAEDKTATVDAVELGEAELDLARILAQFEESVTRSANEFAPHFVAQYLFELAQTFSVFYTKCPILKESDDAKRQLRLLLTRATATVLEQGMHLLGIEVVEEM
jgi:arginyl-tRNA synthetase